MSKAKQIDLEEAISSKLYADLTDPFTGEIFTPRSRNHYEKNDGVPVAPPVELNRPSIRQRIENLLNRDPAVLQRYMQEGPPDGSEGVDMEVPDDPDAPLTASEGNYIDSLAADIAEQAPLPDDGLPRPPQAPTTAAPTQTASGAPGGGPEAVSTAVQPAAPALSPTR